MLKACDTVGPLFGLQGGHDDPSFLHAYLAYAAIASYEPIDTGKELVQLSPPLLQTRRAVFRSAKFLTESGAQARPRRLGDQVGFRIGIASAARHPDIARAQGAAQLPEGTEFVVVAVNLGVGVDHVKPPFYGDKIGGRFLGE